MWTCIVATRLLGKKILPDHLRKSHTGGVVPAELFVRPEGLAISASWWDRIVNRETDRVVRHTARRAPQPGHAIIVDGVDVTERNRRVLFLALNARPGTRFDPWRHVRNDQMEIDRAIPHRDRDRVVTADLFDELWADKEARSRLPIVDLASIAIPRPFVHVTGWREQLPTRLPFLDLEKVQTYIWLVMTGMVNEDLVCDRMLEDGRTEELYGFPMARETGVVTEVDKNRVTVSGTTSGETVRYCIAAPAVPSVEKHGLVSQGQRLFEVEGYTSSLKLRKGKHLGHLIELLFESRAVKVDGRTYYPQRLFDLGQVPQGNLIQLLQVGHIPPVQLLQYRTLSDLQQLGDPWDTSIHVDLLSGDYRADNIRYVRESNAQKNGELTVSVQPPRQPVVPAETQEVSA